MITTIDRAEINRRNAQKSTGPRTAQGKARSRFNAVKHGMTAAVAVLPGEDPDEFRRRLDAWAEALGPVDAVEHFLVEQAATASWKIQRADRVESARLAAAIQAAVEERRAVRRKDADRLGLVLLGDRGRAPDPGLARTALEILDPTPGAVGRDPFRALLDRLESTAEGCGWLLGRWDGLREPLEHGLDWSEDQLVEAIRLSGRQPLDMTPRAWHLHVESRCLVDLDEPGSGDGEDLDEEEQMARDAAIEAEIEAEDRRRLTRQLVGDPPGDEAGARAALLGMVGRASGWLAGLAAAHESRWEAEEQEITERLGLDIGPEEEQVWRYQSGCGRSLRRTLDTLLKLRRQDVDARRRAAGEEHRAIASTTARDGAGAAEVPGAVPRTIPDDAGAPAAAQPPPRGEGASRGVGTPAERSGGRGGSPEGAAPGGLAAREGFVSSVGSTAANPDGPSDREAPEAGARADARSSLGGEAGARADAGPSSPNEPIAPADEQPSPPHEVDAPDMEHPGPQAGAGTPAAAPALLQERSHRGRDTGLGAARTDPRSRDTAAGIARTNPPGGCGARPLSPPGDTARRESLYNNEAELPSGGGLPTPLSPQTRCLRTDRSPCSESSESGPASSPSTGGMSRC